MGLFAGNNVQGWDNRALKYYGLFGFANGVTAPQLLSNPADSGMCGAFTNVPSQSAGVNGITAPVRMIRQVNNAFFMVKNLLFPLPKRSLIVAVCIRCHPGWPRSHGWCIPERGRV